MKSNEINDLIETLRIFSKERDWDKFHTPKNIVMALSGEVGELNEIFQWLTPEESMALDPSQKKALKEELADIFLYLLRLSDITGIDLVTAGKEKIVINGCKYPISKSFGTSKKYKKL